MGYSYTMSGALCCDICDASGGVRRVPCPSKWCQAVAMCKVCRDTKRLPADYHANCAGSAARFRAEREQQAALLAAGEYVRCSALQVADGRVHVLFKNKDGKDIGYYMARETYHAIGICTPSTPADYQAAGKIDAAPSDFVHA